MIGRRSRCTPSRPSLSPHGDKCTPRGTRTTRFIPPIGTFPPSPVLFLPLDRYLDKIRTPSYRFHIKGGGIRTPGPPNPPSLLLPCFSDHISLSPFYLFAVVFCCVFFKKALDCTKRNPPAPRPPRWAPSGRYLVNRLLNVYDRVSFLDTDRPSLPLPPHPIDPRFLAVKFSSWVQIFLNLFKIINASRLRNSQTRELQSQPHSNSALRLNNCTNHPYRHPTPHPNPDPNPNPLLQQLRVLWIVPCELVPCPQATRPPPYHGFPRVPPPTIIAIT